MIPYFVGYLGASMINNFDQITVVLCGSSCGIDSAFVNLAFYEYQDKNHIHNPDWGPGDFLNLSVMVKVTKLGE